MFLSRRRWPHVEDLLHLCVSLCMLHTVGILQFTCVLST